MNTDTVMKPVPWPDSGETVSQFPPLVVETLTVQVAGAVDPGGLVTCVASGAGFVLPACPAKISDDGVKVIPEAICSDTLAVAVFPPLSITETVPL